MRKSKSYKKLIFGLISIIAICSTGSLNAATTVVVPTTSQSGQQNADSSSQNSNSNQNSGSNNVDSSSSSQPDTDTAKSVDKSTDSSNTNVDTSSTQVQSDVSSGTKVSNGTPQHVTPTHTSKATTSTHQSSYKPATSNDQSKESDTSVNNSSSENSKVDTNKEVTNDEQFTKQIRQVQTKPTTSKKNENHLKTPKNVSSTKDDDNTKFKSDFKPIDSGKYFTSSILPWIGYGVLIALGVGGFLFLYKTRNAGTLKGMFTNLKTQLAKDIHHNPYSDHEEHSDEVLENEENDYVNVMENAQKNKSLMANTLFSDNENEEIFSTKKINVDDISENVQNDDKIDDHLESGNTSEVKPESSLFSQLPNEGETNSNEEITKSNIIDVENENTKVMTEDKIDEITKAFSAFSLSDDDLNSSEETLSRLDKKKDLFSVFKKR